MKKSLRISHKNINFNLSYFLRRSSGDPILYLHGLGTSKEDFIQAADMEIFKQFNLISFDFPGCGQSGYSNEIALDVDDLVIITDQFINSLKLKSFHLIGHSMGGLTGLLYATRLKSKVKSFINIEGNLMPADCRVFSRYVTDYPIESNEKEFFNDFINQLEQKDNKEYDYFVSNVKNKVNYYSLRDYCGSIVKYCSRADLLSYFIQMECPRMFIYGEKNKDLPYIDELNKYEIEVKEIPGSDHFPFFSNPGYFFSSIGAFYQKKF